MKMNRTEIREFVADYMRFNPQATPKELLLGIADALNGFACNVDEEVQK